MSISILLKTQIKHEYLKLYPLLPYHSDYYFPVLFTPRKLYQVSQHRFSFLCVIPSKANIKEDNGFISDSKCFILEREKKETEQS